MKKNTKFKFNPEVTLGHVLQLGSFCIVLGTMWVNMDKRITSAEMREDFAAEERREFKRSVSTLAENQTLLIRAVDRITILFDERNKPKN